MSLKRYPTGDRDSFVFSPPSRLVAVWLGFSIPSCQWQPFSL